MDRSRRVGAARHSSRSRGKLSSRAFAWVIGLGGLALLVACSGGTDKRREQAPLPLAVSEPSPTKQSGPEIAAAVDGSIHRGLDCIECHEPTVAPGGSEQEFSKERTQCSNCHLKEAQAYDASVHGRAIARGNSDAARCVHCHGAHSMRPSDDPRSSVYKTNLPRTCGKCHQNPEVARSLGIQHPNLAEHYFESVHALELAQGDAKAPSCVDCHGSQHAVFAASDPRSSVNHANIPRTCGQCHAEEVRLYGKSVHAQALGRPEQDAPTCDTCHSAHEIVKPGSRFKLASDKICGECHGERLEGYLQTYHGRAHSLGHLEVAACYDCHGAHDILPPSDPNSTLSSQNRLATCRNCHPGAPQGFVGFMAHGDYTDRANYPMLYWAFVIMTSLIVGTFAVWGVHTFLWFLRTLLAYAKNPVRFREEKQRARVHAPGKMYTRFRPIDRFCHFLIIISFVTLVATGMPLKFHQEPWARWVFDLVGGAHVAATMHRVGAIISGVYLLLHVASLIAPVRQRWGTFRDDKGKFRVRRLLGYVFGPDSPLPNLDDIKDVRAQLQWFMGRGPRPKFDRFTYWEKFDYFAELWGSAFIGLSGLVMWFPEIFSAFLPGWVVNLAQVIHSQEALLAAGFILTFHFFNGHFRLEKFPLDTVMFSGQISEEEMIHERGRQYERLVAEGRLQEIAASGQYTGLRRVLLNTFGITALVVGLALAVAIFWGLGRLWFGV